jgi:hypothetical protein
MTGNLLIPKTDMKYNTQTKEDAEAAEKVLSRSIE